MHTFDVTIIGGGILGLATAVQVLQKSPQLSIAIVEKEPAIAMHQTSHNSGVIHSGIYYKPGSAKALNCRAGVELLFQFCREHDIPWEICGKVIIATEEFELPRLHTLAQRGHANGVPNLELIGPEKLKEIEPAANGLMALYSPQTSIINFMQVAQAYASLVKRKGAALFLEEKVLYLHKTPSMISLQTTHRELNTKCVINCAGTYADKIARLSGCSGFKERIVPFRGEYYRLAPEKNHLVRGLIYPVPDPKFPFLGVHLSKTMQGIVEAGPNAVLAFSREGYRLGNVALKDCWDFLTYSGFWRMAARHWKVGCYEFYRSFSKRAFLRSLQRLVPQLKEQDIVSHGSGVRSQLIAPNGALVDDFAIVSDHRIIHILNAPSPAATASLAIGKQIAEMAFKHLGS